jgi:hypothetical protein
MPVSPDSIVSRPYFSQDYNRYSYAHNSPLSLTDPNGLTVEDYEGGTLC